jgi:hypothetical protein
MPYVTGSQSWDKLKKKYEKNKIRKISFSLNRKTLVILLMKHH